MATGGKLCAFFEGFRSIQLFPPACQLDFPVTRAILARTDEEAIASDWVAVGNDLRKAMGVSGVKEGH